MDSNLPIIDIAVSTGFNSRQNDGLAFRKVFGLPPAHTGSNPERSAHGNQAADLFS